MLKISEWQYVYLKALSYWDALLPQTWTRTQSSIKKYAWHSHAFQKLNLSQSEILGIITVTEECKLCNEMIQSDWK